MGKELERDLGLPSVTAISIGAMVGSGIFILPGLAMTMAGPAVVFAYFLAGVLVLPAALSKSEMATAMPEAGGTYLYIERAMGPLFGTIAGVGAWFSLTFKGALALVGGAPYLVLLFDLPVTPVALTVAVLLIILNVVGAKQTGRMQIAIVAIMLAVMVWFIVVGAPSVESARFEGFFDSGFEGILAATGFVFVSYAGVTKVASVAEEVENPDRNLPLGILGSLVITAAIYVAIVTVMVGVANETALTNSATPMQVAATNALPAIGVAAVVVAALLALISTANAGILSSSRYPFAMSRDGLAPDVFEAVSERFATPVNAITITGGVLLVLIAFVPIDDIAKLASAFKIMVFILINVALIAFRQGSIEAYDPSFESPLYPVPQLVGIVGGVVLLRYIGFVPLVGAVVIVAGSMVWYYFFVARRGGVGREGAMTDAVRRQVGRDVVEQTESEVESDGHEVLVAVTERTASDVERSLIDLATDLARTREGGIRVAQFDEVPDQMPLPQSSDTLTEADQAFEARMADRATDSKMPVRYGEIVSHDTRHAIVNYAERVGADTLIIERTTGHDTLLHNDADWIENHAPCDVVEVTNLDHDAVEHIGVVTDEGPFDPAKVGLAGALGAAVGATVTFYFPIGADPPESRRNTIDDYLSELVGMCDAPVQTRIVEADTDDAIERAVEDSDLLVVSGTQRHLTDRLFGHLSELPRDETEHGTLIVYGASKPGRLRRAVERRLF
ncbi:Amino acid transporter [Halanaeroarchaeum sp. HSR-CO]|uniref:amino acid permease n=1 Tax=Halanaeroarchaeum sp. HSR-CO TaxID=2866382 RepID=UPI00217EAEF2|nr:amino acid permease [Halanaeroarchaeum sp. HSR-CO]UWG48639.1 Amino acid transporter [Halanaeroarchaeum sp. HSR-CO]